MAITQREQSDRAGRIVEAMRASVGIRGAAGSTFDHVAREAGVSRGLLHYYFGTKERLLVEVCRRDTEIRMAAVDEAFATARSADELIEALVHSLEDLVRDDPGYIALIFELFSSSRHNDELRVGVHDLSARVREHLAEQLEAAAAVGVIRLGAEADAIAAVLFALADGLALRMLSEDERDWTPTLEAGARAIRQLLQPA